MKKFLKKYEEKFLSELKAEPELEKTKSKLTFNNKTVISKITPRQRIIGLAVSFSLILFIGIALSVVILNYNNTPVYEKMEVIDYNKKLTSIRLSNHHDYIDGDIDKFHDDDDEENNGPGILNGNNIQYFAHKNEEIMIAIYISNPKKYEILSFTLNDYKYQSYEFQEGSTSDVIYVKAKCGDVSGIQTFYINELKYIDDTKIKNARYNGERTINVGVTYENIPTLNLKASELITDHSFEIVFESVDIDKIMNDQTFYKAYLFDEEGLVYSKKLKAGLDSFSVSNLKMNTEYQCIVCCSLDVLDGKGNQTIYMYSKTFKTHAGIFNENIVPTENSVVATFDKMNDSVEIIQSNLYVNDVLYQTQDANIVEFKDIYSNTEYRLDVTYQYKLNGDTLKDTITYHFKTLEYTIPSVDFSLSATKDVITVTHQVDDPHHLVKHSTAQLYLNGELQEKEYTNHQFTNLFANNNYKVIVIYTYDLNDQTGEHEITVEKEIKTEAYKDVTFEGVAMYMSLSNSVYLDLSLIDEDHVASNIKVALYYNDTLLRDNLTLTSSVTDLTESYDEVKIVITYEVDMKDGLGVQTKTYTQVVAKI